MREEKRKPEKTEQTGGGRNGKDRGRSKGDQQRQGRSQMLFGGGGSEKKMTKQSFRDFSNQSLGKRTKTWKSHKATLVRDQSFCTLNLEKEKEREEEKIRRSRDKRKGKVKPVRKARFARVP